MITRTKKAIKFYELAIKNAQRVLEFEINQDEKYQEFEDKYRKKGLTTIYFSHCFSFQVYNTENHQEKYFSIENGEIIYEEDIKGIKDMAKELLQIVGKFYE